MPELTLRAVSRSQGNNQALKDGSVSPRGCVLDFEEVPVLVQAFRRMVRDLEFDVCEMAITTYLCAKSYGKPFTALPVFLVRGFHHGAILVKDDGEISDPKQLEGRRVGVNRGYTVTTGVWARAILQEEHGVDLSKVTWVLSGDEHVAEYRAPDNVVAMREGTSLEELLLEGELAAVVGADIGRDDVAPLIPRPDEAAFEALRRDGLYPVNHLIVVRDDLLAAHPHLAADLFDAFAEAKHRYVKHLREHTIEHPSASDQMYRRVMEITGADPLPYGVAPNRPIIDRLIEHAVTQKILDHPIAVEHLFPHNTLELLA